MSNWRFKDLTGQKFNRWTVLSTQFQKNKFGYCLWLCVCECGTLHEVSSSNLKTGSSMSCGCITKERAKSGIIRRGKKGQKHTEEAKKKISIGSRSWIRSPEVGAKISKAKKGKSVPSMQGANHPRWNPNLTRDEKRRIKNIRRSTEWKRWREIVFARDEFTCKECDVIGGKLEAHHIIPVRSDKDKLFDTNNGITLCRPCHQKTIWKESDFAEKYTQIVMAHSN